MHPAISQIKEGAIVCGQTDANARAGCRCKPAQLHDRAILAKDRGGPVVFSGMWFGTVRTGSAHLSPNRCRFAYTPAAIGRSNAKAQTRTAPDPTMAGASVTVALCFMVAVLEG